jgi:peptide/nickel transport system permease protein
MQRRPGFWEGKARWYGLGLAAILLLALLAPYLPLQDPDRIDVVLRYAPPSHGQWLGRDGLGRDVLSRMVWGTQVSMGVGIVAALAVTALGALLGALAGYAGRWVDAFLMRTVDVLNSIPSIYLVLTMIVILGPSIGNVLVVIVLTGWTSLARIVRTEVLSVREREFVRAGLASGASPAAVLFKHVLPNAMAPVYVSLAFGISGAVLMESGLSFLGLGVQPPTPSWGAMLNEGRESLVQAPWLVIVPGLAIFGVLLLVNGLAEAARRHFDPRDNG